MINDLFLTIAIVDMPVDVVSDSEHYSEVMGSIPTPEK